MRYAFAIIAVILFGSSIAGSGVCKVDGFSWPLDHPKCNGQKEYSPSNKPKKQERSAIQNTNIEDSEKLREVTQEQAMALAQLVRLSGFRCSSISAASPFILRNGYNLYCNNFSYSYELQEKGGRWFVTVD